MRRVSKGRISKGYLVDDGTMDTVIRCSVCGQEERFNPEPPEDEETEWDRVEDAFEMFESDHDCEDTE